MSYWNFYTPSLIIHNTNHGCILSKSKVAESLCFRVFKSNVDFAVQPLN